MLYLDRGIGHTIYIGDDIVIKIVEVRQPMSDDESIKAEMPRYVVRVGIEAPRGVKILRGELKFRSGPVEKGEK